MGRLSLLGAFSVLTNCILGPGILGLPWAVAQGGLGLGTFLLILSAGTGFAGMVFLGAAASHARDRLQPEDKLTMANACRLADARELRFAMEVGLVLSCGGALISSLIVIGDSLEPLGDISREHWITIVFLAVPFPLSFFSQISFLRFSSYLSFVMMIYMAFLLSARTVAGFCPMGEGTQVSALRLDNTRKIFQTVPVFTICFCGHMNVFSIVGELQDATAKRIKLVILVSTVAATMIFGAVSTSVVVCFGDMTPQDLLNNYPSTPSVSVARFGMALVCSGFFPLLVQPVRSTCLGWLESAMTSGFDRQASPGLTSAEQQLLAVDIYSEDSRKGYMKAVNHSIRLSYHAITVLIGFLCLGTALATRSLGVVFSLSGATGFALLCNICPPWLYLAVVPSGNDHFMRCTAWALLVYGVIMMPLCITANFIAALPAHSHSQAEQCILPPSCNLTAFHDNFCASSN